MTDDKSPSRRLFWVLVVVGVVCLLGGAWLTAFHTKPSDSGWWIFAGNVSVTLGGGFLAWAIAAWSVADQIRAARLGERAAVRTAVEAHIRTIDTAIVQHSQDVSEWMNSGYEDPARVAESTRNNIQTTAQAALQHIAATVSSDFVVSGVDLALPERTLPTCTCECGNSLRYIKIPAGRAEAPAVCADCWHSVSVGRNGVVTRVYKFLVEQHPEVYRAWRDHGKVQVALICPTCSKAYPTRLSAAGFLIAICEDDHAALTITRGDAKRIATKHGPHGVQGQPSSEHPTDTTPGPTPVGGEANQPLAVDG